MQVRRRGRGSALPQPRIRVRGRGPAGRSCTLFGRAGTLSCALFADFRTRPSVAWDGFRTRRCGSVHGPAGFWTVSVHDVPGAYTAQRGLGRFPYTTRRGGGGRTLYTGDPVRTGVCALVAACTVQTPVGTGLLVRKAPCRRFRAPHAAGSRLAGCSPTQSAEEPFFGASAHAWVVERSMRLNPPLRFRSAGRSG